LLGFDTNHKLHVVESVNGVTIIKFECNWSNYGDTGENKMEILFLASHVTALVGVKIHTHRLLFAFVAFNFVFYNLFIVIFNMIG